MMSEKRMIANARKSAKMRLFPFVKFLTPKMMEMRKEVVTGNEQWGIGFRAIASDCNLLDSWDEDQLSKWWRVVKKDVEDVVNSTRTNKCQGVKLHIKKHSKCGRVEVQRRVNLFQLQIR